MPACVTVTPSSAGSVTRAAAASGLPGRRLSRDLPGGRHAGDGAVEARAPGALVLWGMRRSSRASARLGSTAPEGSSAPARTTRPTRVRPRSSRRLSRWRTSTTAPMSTSVSRTPTSRSSFAGACRRWVRRSSTSLASRPFGRGQCSTIPVAPSSGRARSAERHRPRQHRAGPGGGVGRCAALVRTGSRPRLVREGEDHPLWHRRAGGLCGRDRPPRGRSPCLRPRRHRARACLDLSARAGHGSPTPGLWPSTSASAILETGWPRRSTPCATSTDAPIFVPAVAAAVMVAAPARRQIHVVDLSRVASVDLIHDGMRDRFAREAHAVWLEQRRKAADFGASPATSPGRSSRRISAGELRPRPRYERATAGRLVRDRAPRGLG